LTNGYFTQILGWLETIWPVHGRPNWPADTDDFLFHDIPSFWPGHAVLG